MKTLLTIIMTSIALSANAGRYYYRHYHYYGPRDDNPGGLYLLLILLGLIILIGLAGELINKISWNTKISWKMDKHPIVRDSLIIIFTTTIAALLIFFYSKQ